MLAHYTCRLLAGTVHALLCKRALPVMTRYLGKVSPIVTLKVESIFGRYTHTLQRCYKLINKISSYDCVTVNIMCLLSALLAGKKVFNLYTVIHHTIYTSVYVMVHRKDLQEARVVCRNLHILLS